MRVMSVKHAWNHPCGRAIILLLMMLMSAFVLTGSAWASSSPEAETTPPLRVGWLQEPDSLNPFIGVMAEDYLLWHMNYDFLVGFDAKTLEPRPELATEWEVSDDGLEWTFTIRDDATWQDGQPLTAKDVAFTFNYIAENELLNLSTYTNGITKAEVVDDTHVKLYTDVPKANMLRMVVPILPEHIWSKVSGKAATGSYQNKPPIVGSGPFQTVEWRKGKFVRLEANPDYWGGAPKVNEVIFQLYTNPDTMSQDLKLGNLDGAIHVPAAQFKQLEAEEGITTCKATSWRFIELAMNCYDDPDSKGNPVLLDTEFRKAVAWAVDKEKIVSLAMNGYATVGSSVIVPYSKYHWEPSADQAFTYDPAKSEALLDDAGYKDVDGDGFRETKDGKKLSLRLVSTTDEPQNQTAAKLVAGWLKDIGVKVQLSVLDSGALIDAQYSYDGDNYAPDWDMFIWHWTQDVDPNFIVDIYTPQQIEGWNDCLWTNDEYTKLNTQQAQTIDEAARKPIIERMQQIFYDEEPYVILSYPYQLEAYNSTDWQGWVHVPESAGGGQEGTVLYSYNNIDTYRFVEPVTATTTSDTESPSSTGLIAGIIVAVIVVIIIVAVLLRRRTKTIEE